MLKMTWKLYANDPQSKKKTNKKKKTQEYVYKSF